MATDASMVIRIAANVTELKKNLAEGKVQIETTTAAMQKLATSFSGERLIQSAHNVVAAVNQIGGASKLTEAEQARVNATLEKALAKYAALGQQAPQAMRDLAQATAKTVAVTDTLPQSLSMGERAMGVLKSSFGQFTAASLVANAIGTVIGKVTEFVSQSHKLPGLQASFENLARGMGQNSAKMLTDLQGATKGMVSNMDLMQSSNKAMLLGLPVTAASMTELARTATVLGKAMGQDATKSLDDLITALGRSSPMILDNLGLTVKVGEANETYARKLGKTAESLTDAEKKVAFYQAAMEAARQKTLQLGDQTLTVTERIQQAWTATGNFITQSSSDMNVVLGHAMESWGNFARFMKDAALFTSWDEMAKKLRPTNTRMPYIDVGALARESAIYKEELANAERDYEEWKRKQKQAAADVARGIKENARIASDATVKSFEDTRKAFEGYYLLLLKANTGITHGLEGLALRKNVELSTLNSLVDEWKVYGDAIATVNSKIKIGLDSAPGEHFTPEMLFPKQVVDKTLKAAGQFGQQLSQTIIGAIQGGGNVASSIGAFLGNELGAKLGDKLAKAVGGKFGETLGGMLGPLGAIGGQLLGGLIDKIFNNKGRDAVKEFAEGMGGFDALREKLNVLGADGERLWIQLTQKVGKGNVEQAKSAIAAIEAALAAHKTKAEEAAGAITAAQEAAVGKVTGKINGLTAEYNRLWESIKDEAPEEVMGVVEEQTRARMAAIAKERESAIDELKSLTDSLNIGFEDVLKKLDEFIDRLGKIPPVRVRTEVDTGGATEAPEGYAGGTHGRFLDFGAGTPTVLHGRERVVTEAEGRAEAGNMAALAAMVARQEQALRRMPEMIGLALRDALVQAR